ncbi:MAG: ELWxxDGT repeat protein [Planctomycetaceae bacterium]
MAIRQMLATLISVPHKSRRRNSRISQHSVLECLERRELLAADVSVLKDIATGTPSSLGSTQFTEATNRMVHFNGWTYFGAYDLTHGSELWRTDGISTELFIDVFPNSGSSSPTNLYATEDKLYFVANAGTGFRTLFVTDGTAIGTQQLTTNGNPGDAQGTFNGTTYFYQQGLMTSSGAFWKSNGTVAGTINLGRGSSESTIYSFAQFDGALFYSGQSTSGGQTLHKLTPGTDEFSEVATVPLDVQELTVAGDTLFFLGKDSSSGPYRLWKLTSANGTPEAVAQLGPSAQNFTSIGSTLYFTYFSSAGGVELWKSNGTNAGTVQVKDINPGSSSSSPHLLTPVGSTLFFTATTAANGEELWKSDGTDVGTVLVKDIVPGSGSGAPAVLFNHNGTLVFPTRTAASRTLSSGLPTAQRTGRSHSAMKLSIKPGASFLRALLWCLRHRILSSVANRS